MLTLSLPFTMIFSIGPDAAFDPGPVFGFLFRVTGAVLLCTSVRWTAVQKAASVLLVGGRCPGTARVGIRAGQCGMGR